GVLLCLLLCASGWSDELRAQSRHHYDLGRAAYERGELATALAEFKEAYAIVPIPDLIYNMARCQEQLGQFREAAQSYRVFIATLPEGSERWQLEAHIKQMESSPEVAPSPAPRALAAKKTPVYRRWWLWTGVAAVVVVAAGVGIGVGL